MKPMTYKVRAFQAGKWRTVGICGETGLAEFIIPGPMPQATVLLTTKPRRMRRRQHRAGDGVRAGEPRGSDHPVRASLKCQTPSGLGKALDNGCHRIVAMRCGRKLRALRNTSSLHQSTSPHPWGPGESIRMADGWLDASARRMDFCQAARESAEAVSRADGPIGRITLSGRSPSTPTIVGGRGVSSQTSKPPDGLA
jgi:hypothetical protein